MADRMAVLRAGRLEAIGTPGDLYRRPPSRFVAEFLGEINMLPLRDVRADQGGVRGLCEDREIALRGAAGAAGWPAACSAWVAALAAGDLSRAFIRSSRS